MIEERKKILKMVKDGKLSVDEALELLEELGKSKQQQEEKEEEMIGELSTIVNFEEEEKADSSSTSSSEDKFQSAKDKILDFIDVALKKIKDFDLDFNFGKSVEISHIFQHGDASVNEIDVDLANGSVKLIPWEQKDVRVECDAKVYRVDSADDARESFLRDVIFSIDGQKLLFATQQKWMKIQASIYIPQTEYDKVKIRLFNGSIDSENVNANSFKAKTANGKINLFKVDSNYLEVETANGQIEVRNGRAGDFEAETITGSIKVDGDYEKAELQSFNGGIVCTLINGDAEFLEAKTVTGSIKLYMPKEAALRGELKTNVGNFNIDSEFIQVIEEKSDVVQKFLRFQPSKDSDSVTKIRAESKTGSIELKPAP